MSGLTTEMGGSIYLSPPSRGWGPASADGLLPSAPVTGADGVPAPPSDGLAAVTDDLADELLHWFTSSGCSGTRILCRRPGHAPRGGFQAVRGALSHYRFAQAVPGAWIDGQP